MLGSIDKKIRWEIHRSRDVVDVLSARVANESKKRFPPRGLTCPLRSALGDDLTRALFGFGEIRKSSPSSSFASTTSTRKSYSSSARSGCAAASRCSR
jgi:hypothetical protein